MIHFSDLKKKTLSFSNSVKRYSKSHLFSPISLYHVCIKKSPQIIKLKNEIIKVMNNEILKDKKLLKREFFLKIEIIRKVKN